LFLSLLFSLSPSFSLSDESVARFAKDEKCKYEGREITTRSDFTSWVMPLAIDSNNHQNRLCCFWFYQAKVNLKS